MTSLINSVNAMRNMRFPEETPSLGVVWFNYEDRIRVVPNLCFHIWSHVRLDEVNQLSAEVN